MDTAGSSADSPRLCVVMVCIFLEQDEVDAISGTHYAPVRCISKLQEIWSWIKALVAVNINRTKERIMQ